MAALSNDSNQNAGVPGLASFFSKDEYERFNTLIVAYFKTNNQAVTVDDGRAVLPGKEKLGLLNIAQQCKQAPQNQWQQLIDSHFAALENSQKFDDAFEEHIHDFSFVKPFIAVRLYDTNYVSHAGERNVLGRRLNEEIFAMLVFDFPQSIMGIKPETLTHWQKGLDEVFEIGLQNIRSKYPVEITRQEFGSSTLWIAHGPHFFVTNILFDLAGTPGMIGTHGSLVGLPHRHIALVYPIETVETVEAITALLFTVGAMYRDGPGSISDRLFWFRNNELITLPHRSEGGKIQFFPPDEFAAVLEQLS